MTTIQPILALAAATLSIVASTITLRRIAAERKRRDDSPRPGGANRPASIRAQLVIVLVIASVASVGFVAARGSVGCQVLIIASSREKFDMLKGLQVVFNRSPQWISDAGGSCMTVDVEQVNSGDAERYLENGWADQDPRRPDVWAPASSAWVKLLVNKGHAQSQLVPNNFPSLFQSPLVIAMPEQMAAQLGYPGHAIGWQDIYKLATSRSGWATQGRPDWGAFSLGKTNPTVSSSGLNMLIGTYRAGPAGDATVAAVNSPAAITFAKGIEASVAHYGETANDFLADLYRADVGGLALAYVSAIAIEEQEVLQYNAGNLAFQNGMGVPLTKLVPISPAGGTPYDDHPYVVLSTSHKQVAARRFYDFLTRQQGEFDRNFFRGAKGVAGPDLNAALTKVGPQATPPTALSLPSGAVLSQEITQWQGMRKPARVLIWVHNTGDPGLTRQAIKELETAVTRFQPQDQISVGAYPAAPGMNCPTIVSNSGAAAELAKITVPSSGKGARSGNALFADVETAIDCVKSGFDDKEINAVLIVDMSPGYDPFVDAPGLLPKIRGQCSVPAPCKFVHVFTIGPAGDKGMAAIATNGRGVPYTLGGSAHFLSHVVAAF